MNSMGRAIAVFVLCAAAAGIAGCSDGSGGSAEVSQLPPDASLESDPSEPEDTAEQPVDEDVDSLTDAVADAVADADASPDTDAEPEPTDIDSDIRPRRDAADLCRPGETICSDDFSGIEVCNRQGDGFVTQGLCGESSACDPDSGFCVPVVCEPGVLTCNGTSVYTICNAAGTGLVGPTACEEAHTCVPGDGCVPWYCQPGSETCDENGKLGLCDAKGLQVVPYPWCPDDAPCARCEPPNTTIGCNRVAGGNAPTTADCTDSQTCVPGTGCLDWTCEPNSYGCTAAGDVARCWPTGLGYDLLATCDEPPCTWCTDDTSVVECSGTTPSAFEPVTPTECATDETCVSPLGCIAWSCIPGSVQCQDGVASVCDSTGQTFEPLPAESADPDTGTTWCVHDSAYVVCPPAGGPELVSPTPCAELESCVSGECQPWECEPGLSECLGAQEIASCSEDGLSSTTAYCGVGIACASADESAICDAGPDDVGAAYGSCVPLPSGFEGDWVGLTLPSTLFPRFSVGLSADGLSTVLSLHPVVNRKTGSWLGDLTTNTELAGGSAGTLRVFEDDTEVPVTCLPPLLSPDAMADIVLALDVTGSMNPTLEKLKSKVGPMLDALGAAGINARLGVATFSDSAPAIPETAASTPWLGLTDSSTEVMDFLAPLNAGGGGDSPENPGDAIAFALEQFDFRPAALKILVLFTDNPMHTSMEGPASFAKVPLQDLFVMVQNDLVIHTLTELSGGPFAPGSPYPEGVAQPVVDTRLLSCMTQGTATHLGSFAPSSNPVAAIESTIYAKWLVEAQICTYPTTSTVLPHDVRVEVAAEVDGVELFGQTEKTGILYDP